MIVSYQNKEELVDVNNKIIRSINDVNPDIFYSVYNRLKKLKNI
jgi:hypothetical protein